VSASKVVSDEAARQRAWLEGVLRATGLRATPLAKGAGIAPSTLLRALDADDPSLLAARTIAKIAAAYGVPGIGQAAAPAGLGEPDLAPYAAGPDDDLPADRYRRSVRSRVLDLKGILPGDVVLFDMAATPAAGDVVEAQIYAGMNAETVLRIYDPPYLIARSTDPVIAPKPLPVDGERVRIAAVAVHLERAMQHPRKE
jgi:hypothetical protein